MLLCHTVYIKRSFSSVIGGTLAITMKFKLPAMDTNAQGHLNPVYHSHPSSSSSSHTYFTVQPIRVAAGFPNGNFGEGYLGPETFRGRLELTEEIQRQLEKEKIRAEIIAEEIERRRILKEEVLNELMIERQMAMRSAGVFPSPFIPSHDDLFEPRILHRQPIGFEERIAASLEKNYDHRRQIVPVQGSSMIEVTPTPLPDTSGKEVFVQGKPNGRSLSGTKRKSTPSDAEGSSKVRAVGSKKKVMEGKPNGRSLAGTKRKSTPSDAEGSSEALAVCSKKKVMEEWSCAICQVTATSERGLNDHIRGKKHKNKEKALKAQKTGGNFGLGISPKKPVKPTSLALTTIQPSSSNEKKSKTRKKSVHKAGETCKTSNTSGPNDTKKKDKMNEENKRDELKYWCEMCGIGVNSEKMMNTHKKGKKHKLNQIGKLEAEKTESELDKAAVVTEEKIDTGSGRQ